MTTSDPRGSHLGAARAALLVAATYFYFLLFAEFAFLELMNGCLATEGPRAPMAALALGGVLGGFIAARLLRAKPHTPLLIVSYVGAAYAAWLATYADDAIGFTSVAAMIGLFLGANTVTLAASLAARVRKAQLGRVVGAGTGLAYAVCNIPGVFNAKPEGQTLAAATIALAGALLALSSRREPEQRAVTVSRPALPLPFAPWILVFLALVWLDSAAFYIIQHTEALKRSTWTGAWQLGGNAVVHLGAALVAGIVLDLAKPRTVVTAAWIALLLACLALKGFGSGLPAGPLYAVGVSLYSTAFVHRAAYDGRPLAIAFLFGIAGWLGSALGIGMAQDLHTIPWAILALSALPLFARSPRNAGWLAGAMLVLLLLGRAPSLKAADEAAIQQGREVYIAEGCLHCHSQYVRPQVSADRERWGPTHPLDQLLAEKPPLPGNRRQGPDLSNVGNRRSTEWNRLHLQQPRAVSPGSRMPSYAHLFRSDANRGEALLAYLAALGSETQIERQEVVQRWAPLSGEIPLSPRASAGLFVRQCAQCHGDTGEGNGPLARLLTGRPPNWQRDPWRRVSHGDPREVARVIKFGVPGTAMAGHETWSDAEILGLAQHVIRLHHAVAHENPGG